jgi:hypothetical protein
MLTSDQIAELFFLLTNIVLFLKKILIKALLKFRNLLPKGQETNPADCPKVK